MFIFLLSLIVSILHAFEYPEGDPNVVSFEVFTCGNVNRQQVEDALENSFFHGELFTVEIDDTTFLASVTDADEMIKPFETLPIRLQQHLSDIFNCAMKVKNLQHIFSELVPEQDSLLETTSITMFETSVDLGSDSTPPQALDLRPKIPGGVRSQGRWSTCAAFAAATMKSYQENLDYGLDQVMSPRFIYAFRRNFPGKGMYISDVGHVLRTFGSIQEKKMPYSGMNRNQDENSISDEIKADALEHRVTHASIAKIKTSRYQNNVQGFKDIIKKAINDHGVGIITTAVFNFGCEMWRHSPKLRGWHAMAVVGYTDEGITIQNSWGTRWCRGGYTFASWEEAVKYTKSYYFTQDLSSPGYTLIEENALCNNRGSTSGLDSRYSKKVANLAACNAFVESNGSCGKFFNFGTDGSCDCVPIGSTCGNTPSKNTKVYQRSHYQNSPYVMIRNWHFCGNRGSSGGRDSRYSKNVANIGACFAFVQSSASCGEFFSLGWDGWCDCVPAGSTCGEKYQARYRAYRRTTYPIYSLIYNNALCNNRGSKDGLDSRYSKKVANIGACSAFVESSGSCGNFFSFGTDGSCDCVPVGSSCGNTPMKNYKVYTRLNYQEKFREISGWSGCKWDHTVLSLTLTECADLASEKGFTFFTHGTKFSYIHCAFYARCTVDTYGPTEHAMKLYEITDNGK